MLPCARFLRCVALVALAAGGRLAAQTYIPWTGLGANANWTTAANWQGGVAPANDGTASVLFGSTSRTSLTVNTSQNVKGLKFDFSSGDDFTYLLSGSSTSLTVGSDGFILYTGGVSAISTSTPQTAYLQSSLGLVLGAAQTWTTASGTNLVVAGSVSGSAPLTLSGSGYVGLAGNNTFSGGTTLAGGSLALDHNNALGTGALTVTNAATILSTTASRTLANALNLNTSSLVRFQASGGDLHFTGPVTLGANAFLDNAGQVVYFDGAIGETGGARSLTISGSNAVVLTGNNTYTGGTRADNGAILFRTAGAVPSTGLLSSTNLGYVGAGFTTGIASGFIARFSTSNTAGTIGFDTDPAAANPNVINDAINLTAFNPLARLGSATRASLSSSATITPATGAGYRFGGGGGSLWVDSKLTGSGTTVTADSSRGTELTVYLTYNNLILGGNDYTGLTTATHSAIVFGSGSAPGGSFTLGAGGYIGTQDLTLLPSLWINKFTTTTTTGVIGFDTNDLGLPIAVGSFLIPIDLSRFTGNGTTIALGTTSAATFAGAITLPPNQANYHFAGYKGGAVTVTSTLSGNYGVRLGDAADYPDYDRNNPTRLSSVTLSANNSYTGGTTLYAGRLVLDHVNALGTGALTVDNSSGYYYPQVQTSLTGNPTFANALVVRAEFDFGGPNSFTWSGNITDGTTTDRIWKFGASNLTLSGSNAGFSGGFYISEGTITFAGNSAAGTGTLDFGSSGTVTAAFTSAAPTLFGLQSDTTSARLNVASGTALTLNQSVNTTFRGQIQGAGSIVKSGTGLLRLEAAGSYTGGTTITNGTIQAAATGALGTNTITLNGGALNVASGVTLANSIAFGASGGRLAGSGAFSSSVALGANSGVAPGSSVGTLSFNNGLTWGQGAFYDVEVQNATGTAGTGWDTVQVTGNLTFNATLGSPFTIFLRSLDASGAPGNTVNFTPTNAYAWTILSSTNLVGFNANAVTINTSGFTSPLNGGSFSISNSSNDLVLNFTPVPEPSTWALLVMGLGAVAVVRRKRRS